MHQQLHIEFLDKFIDMCNYNQVSASNHEKKDSLQRLQVIEIGSLQNVICVIDLQNLMTCIDEICDGFEC